MGKGDRKTAKGKRSISSYGNVRSSVTKVAGTPVAPVVKKTTAATKAVAMAPAKKVVAKKAAG
jgi:30S ribosomal protein S31